MCFVIFFHLRLHLYEDLQDNIETNLNVSFFNSCMSIIIVYSINVYCSISCENNENNSGWQHISLFNPIVFNLKNIVGGKKKNYSFY